MSFIVAYDIADPRRLKKTAQHLERHALRVQKSVFLFDGTYAELRNILSGLLGIIDIHLDRVQAWPIGQTTTLQRIDLGTTLPARPICVVVGRTTSLVLEQTV